MSLALTVRTMEQTSQGDVDAVMTLLRASGSTWSRDQLRRAQHVWVVEQHRSMVAALVFQIAGNEAEVHEVVVHPTQRRKGVARYLFRYWHDFAIKRGVDRAILEVRASNKAAQFLYRGLGYEEIGCRKGTYRNPVEDAIMMRTVLQ